MKNVWYLAEFSIGEIRQYVKNRAKIYKYDVDEMLGLLEEVYLGLKKDNLWYEVDTDTTYEGAGWVSKPSEPVDPKNILNSRDELLNWVFGHEVYCEIGRQINLKRMKNEK